MSRRLSICYVVPGHDLMSTMGPTRNVLSLARALGEWADVTVAFRRLADAQPPAGQPLLEIEPRAAAATFDDAANSGIGYGQFFRYLRTVRNFAERQLAGFDVILEKSWLLSGYVSARCLRRGQLAIPIENIVQNSAHASRQQLMKYLRLRVGGWLAGRNLRRAPLIIAETEFLKREIARFHRVVAGRIAVVNLGVDRTLFRPMDQMAARHTLGIAPDVCVLSYVGVLDLTHNLEPVIRALGAAGIPGVELHVIGDGARRDEYQQLANSGGARVVFHGKVPHAAVPMHIAAGDLCLAPYDAVAFSSGELGYSTMKIPEYLSAGRPVVSVRSGRIRSLIAEGECGFLFDNTFAEWQRFLAKLPARERLHAMGTAAARVALPSWEDTARGYLALCEHQLREMRARG
jgi:glycosyltransferase involved in cell wall biosynthesis